jgi:hypothetical protein
MFERILRSHLIRYPDMQIQDVYKLIHQAAMGSEHAVADPDAARKWIEREIAEMGNGQAEPAIDPISPNGEIVRVHLRPYVQMDGSIEKLVAAFVHTANEHHSNIVLLEHYWAIATMLGRFPTANMENFIESMKANHYPAVHHSSEYKTAYHPAYRVIAQKFFPRSII